MDEAVKELGSFAVSNAPTAASLFGRVASIAGALVALLWVVLVPLLTFFFLRDYENIVDFCRELIPPAVRPRVLEHLHAVDQVLSGFVRGELTAGAILTSLYWLGWGFCGLDLSLAVAAIAGFGVMIPYVGPTVGFLLALALSLTQMQSGWMVLEVAVVFAVVQALDATVISPRVIGGRVGLPAVVVILAVAVFGTIFGFVGALTAVPITAILRVVAKVLIERYRYSDAFAAPASAGPVAVAPPPPAEASEKKTAGR
jgi:predicted PurR-regulated permease PerM